MAKRRILVVDDEEDIRQILCDSLADDNFEVITCSDGYEALELIKEGFFELIITDLRMPGIDGIELIDTIKQISPEVPVIMLTAYGSAGVQREMDRLQAHRYFEKPFSLEELKEAVKEALQ